MNIFNKTFDLIKFEDVENLITQSITEGQNLEYKKEMWGTNDEGKREMLRDISSFANKFGGYIIIGMEEEPTTGQAKQIVNIQNAEQERDKIISSSLANIQPRIPGLKIKCLNKNNLHIILIFIPNSLLSPHLITFGGLYQFWIRHDRQKSRMTIEEIKEAFLKNNNMMENTKEFMNERREEILQDISSSPFYILSATPLDISREFIDISDMNLRKLLKCPPSSRRNGWNLRFDILDAQPSYFGLKIGNPLKKSFELHRNGYMEAKMVIAKDTRFIEESIQQGGGVIPIIYSYPMVEYLHSFISQLNQIKEYIGYEGQYLINVSFLNIKNFGLRKLKPGNIMYSMDFKVWGKVNLEIGPLAFDNINVNKMTKNICDRIWRSFGYENEPFSGNGEFKFGD